MPFSIVDFEQVAFWSNYIYLGYYNIYQGLFDIFGQSIYRTQYPPLIYYSTGFWLSLLNFFHLLDTSSWKTIGDLVITYTSMNKISYSVAWYFPDMNRTLFLLKIPYLILDLAIAYLLVQMVEEKRKSLIFVLWFFTPVTLLISYMDGQFDIIPTFFVVLSLYYAKKSHELQDQSIDKYSLFSVLFLGIGAGFKNYPFLLLPMFVIFLSKKKVSRSIKLFFIGLSPYVISIAPFLIFSPRPFLELVAISQNTGILGLFFDVGTRHLIYVFLLIYSLILLHAYYQEISFSFDMLWKYCFVILTLLYITSYWHPQWYIWIIPFTMLVITKYHRLIGLYFLQMISYGAYLGFGNLFGIGALGVSFPILGRFPGLNSGIAQYMPFEKFFGFFFTAFVAVSIYMVYFSFKNSNSSQIKEYNYDLKTINKKILLTLLIFSFILSLGLVGYLYIIDNNAVDMPSDSSISINKSVTVGQSFISHYSNLRMIQIRASSDTTAQSAILHLRSDPTSTTDIVNVHANIIETNPGGNYASYRFTFSPLADSRNKTYYFEIENPDSSYNMELLVSSNNSYSEGNMYINNNPASEDLVFTTLFKGRFSEIADELVMDLSRLINEDKWFFGIYFLIILFILFKIYSIKSNQ